jgi:hypothetical protein
VKFVGVIVLSLVLFAGCAQQESPMAFSTVPGPSRANVTLPPAPVVLPAPTTNAPPAKATTPQPKPPIVTPDTSLTGKVVKFNESARIVVLEFSILNMPAAGRQLFIYRNDLKVGEVKTTTWQKQEHIVADLINGEAREGDVVRDR